MGRPAGEGRRANNVGFLRLILASLVILGHAPEMIDGNRSRDLVARIFGSSSLGELSVDGFFLLSGFLISKSMLQTKAVLPYVERRVLRIYPAFILTSLLCVFVLAPLVGAVSPPVPQTLFDIIKLGTVTDLPGAYPGLDHYRGLNGSLWTIAYEFRCYLLVAFLWWIGLLQRRNWTLVITIIATLACMALPFPAISHVIATLNADRWFVRLIGHPDAALVLTTAFLVGACIYLFWDVVESRLSMPLASGCAVAALALMCEPWVARVVPITLGAVPLFWLAFQADLGRLQKINDRWDISYGVYLYGWPIANTTRWLVIGISPWLLALLTLPTAYAFGAASWWGLERWAKDLRRSRSKALHGPERSGESS